VINLLVLFCHARNNLLVSSPLTRTVFDSVLYLYLATGCRVVETKTLRKVFFAGQRELY
jgi:hypothetical protein